MLSGEEEQLWARVTATIRPLSRDSIKSQAVEINSVVAEVQEPVRPVRRPPQPATAAAPRKIGTTLDSGWDRRLRSGAVEPDRVIDLHGLNLDRAWAAIDSGLERAIGRGERLVLLVTGHHRPGEPPVERGKIRAAVHDWLGASRHAADIATVRGAHRRHGGGGSLYLVLRRQGRR